MIGGAIGGSDSGHESGAVVGRDTEQPMVSTLYRSVQPRV